MKEKEKSLSKYAKGMSLREHNPKLTSEWHPTKNGDLTPSDVTYGSHKKVWWLCDKGHEWEAEIKSRSGNGTGCPYCSGHLVTQGVNDLLTCNPQLASEWHPTKNGDLTPKDVAPYSNKKVWWLCSEGHEWETRIQSRSKGRNCPYCAGSLLIQGVNDLQTCNPKLSSEWHPVKNGGLTPSDVTKASDRKVWWLCDKGHEWEAKISNRCLNNNKCPICSKRHKLLHVYSPALVAEWHPTKNGTLIPSDFTTSSEQKVWWRCSKGHEWKAAITRRYYQGTGCPYCAKHKPRIVKAENSLLTLYPELAKQWHPTKNNDLTPANVTKASNKKVWWMCDKGHEWEAKINSRSIGKNKCPICSGHLVTQGANDLQTCNPKLAKQWHPTKNGGLTPSDVTYGSHKKVWWLCDKGHEWEAEINSRSRSGNGTGCPYCSGRSVLQGVNDLLTCNPQLASEWHPTKNGDLTPANVTKTSSKKVWWLCNNGHEWKAKIATRSMGSQCPYCKSRILILSCTIGEIIYIVDSYHDEPVPVKVCNIIVSDDKIIKYTGYHFNNMKNQHEEYSFSDKDFGKRVFLTKTKAEKMFSKEKKEA